MNYEDIKLLLERCSKHRGYRTTYRSPPHFWDIDFRTPTEEKSNENEKKPKELKDNRYNRWKKNVDKSPLLHSTFLK